MLLLKQKKFVRNSSTHVLGNCDNKQVVKETENKIKA